MQRMICTAVLGLWGMVALAAGGPQYAVEVEGLNCPVCERKVEEQLLGIEGVKGVKADHKAGRVSLEVAEGVTLDESEVRAGVEAAGYRFRALSEVGG